ncbi:hypothetical protein MHT86_10640, partial [Corynebacterium mastitidis]
ELILPEGGQEHKDVAKAEGVPPSPENPDEPGDVPPVPSNEDPAHAKTPKSKSAAIALKKYIGDQEFTGSEKPQVGGFGSAGVIDAQDPGAAYEASKDQDLTVTFAVTNTGDLNLKDVKVSDELITGEGFESSELSAI